MCIRDSWGDDEESTKAGAFALPETYLRDTPIPLDERPEGVEVSVELDLARHGLPKLVGIMDLVRKGGCIVDYKTTSRTPDSEKVLHFTEVQTTSYAMLYREATDRQESGIEPVSYTHLDVYKRQALFLLQQALRKL